jgi:DNA excision repair protein ERCC-1
MSNNDKGGNSPPNISNPYARKRPISSSNNPRNNDYIPKHPPAAPASFQFQHAASFSQAFQNIDDTSHFKQQIKTVARDPKMEKLRAEQRALDLQENQHHHKEIELKNMSDKDHHVLFQPHVLYVSTKQKGNGVLKYIRNVPFAFSKMVPDYIMSATNCALFLSIKYHQLYPHYIHRRLAELKTDFRLRVLIVLVDVEDNANAILVLNKLAVTHSMTLVLAWSEQEVARYLETYKALNGKDASSIQKKDANNYADQCADFLTAAKPVNKTDSANLLSHFSNIQAIMAASKDELALCSGLGQVKVQKLHDAFHKPFSTHVAEKLRSQRLEKTKKEERENDDHDEEEEGSGCYDEKDNAQSDPEEEE